MRSTAILVASLALGLACCSGEAEFAVPDTPTGEPTPEVSADEDDPQGPCFGLTEVAGPPDWAMLPQPFGRDSEGFRFDPRAYCDVPGGVIEVHSTDQSLFCQAAQAGYDREFSHGGGPGIAPVTGNTGRCQERREHSGSLLLAAHVDDCNAFLATPGLPRELRVPRVEMWTCLSPGDEPGVIQLDLLQGMGEE